MDIWVVPAEGGEARQLTDHPGYDWIPEWSRDGRWVFFTSDRDGGWRQWRVTAEGGKPEPVTSRPGQNARVSLDGDWIFYRRSMNIWALSFEDGTEDPLTELEGRPGNAYGGGGTLATDGEYLYFNWGRYLMDLWVMDVIRE